MKMLTEFNLWLLGNDKIVVPVLPKVLSRPNLLICVVATDKLSKQCDFLYALILVDMDLFSWKWYDCNQKL